MIPTAASLFSQFGSKTAPQLPSYDSECSIKLIMLGESGSGKTSLSQRFSTDEFHPYSESTVGASYCERSMIYEHRLLLDSADVDDDNRAQKPSEPSKINVTFKMWDTAGQEKYHAMASMYYRGAAAAILVFDISRPSTFQTLQLWVEELKAKGPPDIVLIVCGNKCDLDHPGDRQVSREEGDSYAMNIGACYMETSAKVNTNVKELFEEVARQVTDIPVRGSELNGSDGTAEIPISLGATSQDFPASRSACCGS